MREMPRETIGGTVPTVSNADFYAHLKAIAGRELTADEITRAEEMASHNWTVRVIADELFGAEVTARYFAPKPKEYGDKTTTIGDAVLKVVSVSHARTDEEDGGQWLVGNADIQWVVAGGPVNDYRVHIGCWLGTDDDYSEWCVANEGASILLACVGVSIGDTRGSFIRAAMPDECEELGAEVCRLLRLAAADD